MRMGRLVAPAAMNGIARNTPFDDDIDAKDKIDNPCNSIPYFIQLTLPKKGTI